MTDVRFLAETAFHLHEKKYLSREELVSVLQECVNCAAIKNGYADKYGLPFPERSKEAPRAP